MNSFKNTRLRIIVFCIAAFAFSNAIAKRVVDESVIIMNGEERRYYHLYDSEPIGEAPIILLISGSGCHDFGSSFSKFFQKYPANLNVYFLEKPDIQKDSDGSQCSRAYIEADQLERRVSDTIDFMTLEPTLRLSADRSVAILGFSEGGTVAPIVASKSKKIGWLAAAGSGGGLTQAQGFLIFADRGVEPYAKSLSKKVFLKEYALIQADPNSLTKAFFGHSYRYWNSHLFYEPIPTYAKLDMPIVVAMGEKDENDPIESGLALQKYFAAHPERNFRLITYPNANHGLKTAQKDHAVNFVAGLARWFNGDPNAFNED